MAQDYYTLEEAATIVRISPDELKQLARKGELRSFQDRGTWRFRVQDIQELARRRGLGSDPELVMGEAPSPRPADSPAPRSPAKPREPEVFEFDLGADDESIGVGNEFLGDKPGSGRKQGGSSKRNLEKEGPKSGPRSPGPRSPGPRSPGPKSPTPKPGSDSDVRLVADGSDMDFQISLDSDAKLVDDSGPQPKSPSPARGRTGMTGPVSPQPGKSPVRRSGLNPPAPPLDSGVRLVPLDSDSDVRIVGGVEEGELPIGAQPPRSASDSDIRLEKHKVPPSDEGMLTEEINLDEELRKDEERPAPQAKIRPKPPSTPETPAASPFELSEPELSLPPEDSGPQSKGKSLDDSSSDFELTPMKDDSSPLDPGSSEFDLSPVERSSPLEEPSSPVEPSSPLQPGSDEDFHLELPEEDIGLGAAPRPSLKGPSSGVRLDRPADSGISLEQGGEGSDEIEFELTLDAESTPRPQSPASGSAADDSDSEFELTLDADDAKMAPDSDSEFELTLDTDDAKMAPDSDSEFELTLDDSSGSLPGLEKAAPQAKPDSGEKDIFDTDFDVPALEEESGSEAVALEDQDTGLESSDFDLALSEDDAPSADESQSEVVTIDEEEAPRRKPRGKTRKAPPPPAAAEEEEAAGFEQFGTDDVEAEPEVEAEIEGEVEVHTVVKEKVLPAAPWGVMPVLFMVPCVAVMVLVALLGFELVQNMNGYKSPGLVTRALNNIINPQK
jgi:excisionase family DNA binding protein